MRESRIACSAALKPAGFGAVVLGPHRLPNLGFAGAGAGDPSLFPPGDSEEFQQVVDDRNVRRIVSAVKEGARQAELGHSARRETYYCH
jgi:hypothetical protein